MLDSPLHLKRYPESSSLYVPASLDQSFVAIPHTVTRLLTGEASGPSLHPSLIEGLKARYDAVVVVVIDGFGWRFIEEMSDSVFHLGTLCSEAQLSCLSAQFPSTTACHITSLHTGLPVAQTGIYEWFYYEPILGEIICPLRTTIIGRGDPRHEAAEKGGTEKGNEAGGISDVPFNPARVFPFETIYNKLAAQGVASFVAAYQGYALSPYSNHFVKGAIPVPFTSVRDGAAKLRQVLESSQVPTYAVMYIDTFDSTAHLAGPTSKRLRSTLDSILAPLKKELLRPLGQAKDVLILLTADHGHATVAPEQTIYVDRDIPGFASLLATTESGWPVAPVGSPRDFFLTFREETREEGETLLRSHVGHVAEIFQIEELINEGVFNGVPSERLIKRLGTTVVLPKGEQTVFWLEGGRFEQKFRGHHGGLSREELLIPLFALEI